MVKLKPFKVTRNFSKVIPFWSTYSKFSSLYRLKENIYLDDSLTVEGQNGVQSVDSLEGCQVSNEIVRTLCLISWIPLECYNIWWSHHRIDMQCCSSWQSKNKLDGYKIGVTALGRRHTLWMDNFYSSLSLSPSKEKWCKRSWDTATKQEECSSDSERSRI
jgi:hypothetical protein